MRYFIFWFPMHITSISTLCDYKRQSFNFLTSWKQLFQYRKERKERRSRERESVLLFLLYFARRPFLPFSLRACWQPKYFSYREGSARLLFTSPHFPGSHSLEKYLNFRGSSWKVLEFHFSLKSPWICVQVLEKSLKLCASPWKVLQFSSTLNVVGSKENCFTKTLVFSCVKRLKHWKSRV